MAYLPEGVYTLDPSIENSIVGNEVIDAFIIDVMKEQAEKEWQILEQEMSNEPEHKFSLRHRIKMKLFFTKLRIIGAWNDFTSFIKK